MPTYEYECGSCGKRHEVFQSITSKPLRKCPACGKSKLKRLIGAGSSIIFRGSGFYQTDYRSDGYKKAAKAESDSASGAAKTEKAADKPAAKSSTETKSDNKSSK